MLVQNWVEQDLANICEKRLWTITFKRIMHSAKDTNFAESEPSRQERRLSYAMLAQLCQAFGGYSLFRSGL